MKFLRKLISPKILIALAVAVVVSQFVSPEVAFAITDTNENETLKAFAQLFSIFVNIFTFLSLVFLNYGGDLVGTEFLTAPEPMAAIRPMWVIIRNITNVLFVLVLLFLAFSNLFSSLGGGDGGNWTVKDKLPKVILALIAINFSLLGFKVVLDAVHIGTITIFSIPDNTLNAKGKQQLGDMLKSKVVTTQEGTVTYVPFYQAINELMCGAKEKWAEGEGVKEGLPEDCLFAVDPTKVKKGKRGAAQNLFLAFGVQFQKLQNLPSFAARLNDWSDVFTSVIFVSILSLAQVIALAAVFIALLVRMVVLWIAMVFSPLLIAGSIMGFGQGEGGEVSKMITTSIVMPLKIAAAFSISFLMMDTMMDIGGPSGDFIKTGASLSSFGSTGYGLLWSIATIVVFWKAAFWALKGSSADGLIQKIQGGAEKAGGFLARAGTVDREFFPMPGKGGTQKVAVSNLFKTMTSGVATMHRNRMNQDYNELTGPEGFNLFNKELTETTKAIDEFKNKVSSLQTPDKQKETNKYFENKGFKTLLDNYESVNKGVLTNSGFTDAELKPLRDAAAKGNGNVEDVEKAFRKLLESKNLTPAASYSGKPADETKPTTGASTDSSYTIVNAETTDARKITLKNGDAEEATFTDIDKVKTY